MKKFATIGTIAVMTAGLAGCTPGHNIPGATAAGAAAGGLLGAAFFHGRGAWIGVLGGALVGGIVGNQIGKHMDRQDEINMQNAIVHTPVGEEATWTNDRTDITYNVRPVKNYHSKGRYCREYQTRVKIGDEWKDAYGKACRMPDGNWKVVN